MNDERSPSPAEVYEDFLVPGIHARWTPLFLDYAAPVPGIRVLDLACGTGIVSRSLAPSLLPGGNVMAVDVSEDMLSVARTCCDAPNVEWQQGDTAALSTGDAHFDLILCQQGLQFFEKPASAAAEMRRVLKKEGRAVVSIWQGLEHHPLYEALLIAEAEYLDAPVRAVSRPFQFGDSDVLQALLEGAGFARVDVARESLDVRFPSAERFVALTILAGAAIVPESDMDAEQRKTMVQEIGRDIEPILQDYVDGNDVTFPMHAYIATAHA